jgi:uncharacterized repeat protein (TIGR01451 family)
VAQRDMGAYERQVGQCFPQPKISSAGPLTDIIASNTLGCQVAHSGASPSGQTFGSSGGDLLPHGCGTGMRVGDVIYSFDQTANGVVDSPYFGATLPLTAAPFTPVASSGVLGAGTEADPYRIVTVVDAGMSGVRLTETVSYVVGEESYRVDTLVTNTGGISQEAILYRYADCYVGTAATDRDDSAGIATSGGGAACVQPPGDINAPAAFELLPLSGGSNFAVGDYADSGDRIAAGLPLADQAGPALNQPQTDTHMGLSWNIDLAAGASTTRSLLTTASMDAELPLLAKTSAAPSSVKRGAVVTFTLSAQNRSDNPVTLDSLTDQLPPGFTFVAGSVSGAGAPAISGRTLKFNGPFDIAAGATKSITFRARAATATPGAATNSVSGDAGDTTVVSASAAITVLAGAKCFGKLATVRGGPGAISGTAKADVIIGSARADRIKGLGGNDVICSLGGKDVVVGGAGNERVRGGAGSDTISGSAGRDVLFGQTGADVLRGGAGRDTLKGGPGPDRLVGGPGVDILRGGPGKDREIQ